jgi:hypothetical protein
MVAKFESKRAREGFQLSSQPSLPFRSDLDALSPCILRICYHHNIAPRSGQKKTSTAGKRTARRIAFTSQCTLVLWELSTSYRKKEIHGMNAESSTCSCSELLHLALIKGLVDGARLGVFESATLPVAIMCFLGHSIVTMPAREALTNSASAQPSCKRYPSFSAFMQDLESSPAHAVLSKEGEYLDIVRQQITFESIDDLSSFVESIGELFEYDEATVDPNGRNGE